MTVHFDDAGIPEIFEYPQPLTLEEYEQLVPDRIELVRGYLIDGKVESQARQKLLAALLMNCGLEQAVALAEPEMWYAALERVHGGREQ